MGPHGPPVVALGLSICHISPRGRRPWVGEARCTSIQRKFNVQRPKKRRVTSAPNHQPLHERQLSCQESSMTCKVTFFFVAWSQRLCAATIYLLAVLFAVFRRGLARGCGAICERAWLNTPFYSRSRTPLTTQRRGLQPSATSTPSSNALFGSIPRMRHPSKNSAHSGSSNSKLEGHRTSMYSLLAGLRRTGYRILGIGSSGARTGATSPLAPELNPFGVGVMAHAPTPANTQQRPNRRKFRQILSTLADFGASTVNGNAWQLPYFSLSKCWIRRFSCCFAPN